MDSCTTLGEMVTVDASFLIDGAGSVPSSFEKNAVSTFYSSEESNIPNKDGGLPFQNSGTSSGNNENVIRLQYIDQGDVPAAPVATESTTPTNLTMPSQNPTGLTGITEVCATCTKSGDKSQLVM